MAREDVSERGLPSLEERRQILRRAGIVLHEARDLMAQLDQHESSYPRSVRDHQQVLDRMKQRRRIPVSSPLPRSPGVKRRPGPGGEARPC